MKEKFLKAHHFSNKIFWLIVTPQSWTIGHLQKEFTITFKLSKKVKQIQMKYRFGSYPPSRRSVNLFETDFSLVKSFYLSVDISRLMLGQKDCVLVKQTNGKRVKIQKRLNIMQLKRSIRTFQNFVSSWN